MSFKFCDQAWIQMAMVYKVLKTPFSVYRLGINFIFHLVRMITCICWQLLPAPDVKTLCKWRVAFLKSFHSFCEVFDLVPCPAFKSSTSLLWIKIFSTESLNWFGTSTREGNLAAPSFETSCEERNSQPAISTMQRLDLHFFFLCSPRVINLWRFGCGGSNMEMAAQTAPRYFSFSDHSRKSSLTPHFTEYLCFVKRTILDAKRSCKIPRCNIWISI